MNQQEAPPGFGKVMITAENTIKYTADWIDRELKEPTSDLEYILVLGLCGKPHVAYFCYKLWRHVEFCYVSGDHFMGEEMKFRYWKKI